MRSLLFLFALILVSTATNAQTFEGRLERGDSTRPGGEYFDEYTFKVDAARYVTVRLESRAFDTYLIVVSPSGSESFNDDFEGRNSSQLSILATETGTWRVRATSLTPRSSGSYSVKVTLGGEADVEVIEGRLDSSDIQAVKGEFSDTHRWESGSSAEFSVELEAMGFDGYLVVTSPNGRVWRADAGNSSRLTTVGPLSGDGRWRFDVTSMGPEETGAYDLKIIWAETQVPSAGGGGNAYQWVEAREVRSRRSVVVGGLENGVSQAVCRAEGSYIGKEVAGRCNYARANSDLELTTGIYDLLMMRDPQWERPKSLLTMRPEQLVRAGGNTPVQYYVCRGSFDGGLHVGGFAGGNCLIGYGGRKVMGPELTNIELLNQ